MSKVNPNAHYVYLHRGGRDPMEHLSIVPVDMFNRLKPHEDDLESGDVPDEVSSDVDAVYDMEDLSHSFSDDDFEEIPSDHFLRVTIC